MSNFWQRTEQDKSFFDRLCKTTYILFIPLFPPPFSLLLFLLSFFEERHKEMECFSLNHNEIFDNYKCVLSKGNTKLNIYSLSSISFFKWNFNLYDMMFRFCPRKVYTLTLLTMNSRPINGICSTINNKQKKRDNGE